VGTWTIGRSAQSHLHRSRPACGVHHACRTLQTKPLCEFVIEPGFSDGTNGASMGVGPTCTWWLPESRAEEADAGSYYMYGASLPRTGDHWSATKASCAPAASSGLNTSACLSETQAHGRCAPRRHRGTALIHHMHQPARAPDTCVARASSIVLPLPSFVLTSGRNAGRIRVLFKVDRVRRYRMFREGPSRDAGYLCIGLQTQHRLLLE